MRQVLPAAWSFSKNIQFYKLHKNEYDKVSENNIDGAAGFRPAKQLCQGGFR
jgi:hypothetical protein